MSFEIDINAVKRNPTKMQSLITDAIEDNSDGIITFTDPTNPFLMLLEADIALTNDAIVENITNLRKNYSSLAISPNDVYHHISDIEMVNMFAVPATATILFTINLKDVIDNGFIEDNKRIVTIPEYSKIVVNETTFTLLNDLEITYYTDSDKVYIEQLVSEDDLSIKDLGVLNNDIITDKNENRWIVFETIVKQLDKATFEDNIISGMGYKKEIRYEDQYHYTNVFVKNASTNYEWKKIKVTNSDMIFNPTDPTIHVEVLNGSAIYTVPEIYIMNETITGLIKIVLYTSKGELVLNIDKFSMEDFTMTLGNTTKNETTAVSPNINILMSSNVIVDGGRNQRTMEELREIVINNATGDNELPITSHELIERASYNGFDISKVLDVVTDRYYIASKNIPAPTIDSIKSKMDIFVNKTAFILEEYVDNMFVNVVDNKIGIIRSGAIFINENNIVTLLDNTKSTRLFNLNNEDLILELSTNKYFYNPYYYITSVVGGVSTNRVFDFDVPTLDNLRILSKVNNDISVNIDKYTVYSTNRGFTVVFTITGNEKFNELSTESIRAQMSLPMANSSDRIYFHCSVEDVTGYLKFEIDTNFYVNDDNQLSVLNGYKELVTSTIDLISDVEVILYTVDQTVEKTIYSVTDDIKYEDNEKLALSKEMIHLNLGKELEYLWSPVNTDYTERKYKKYDYDVPLTYTERVFEVNPEDGSFFTPIEENGYCEDIEYNILHEKGDPMLDNDGNRIFKYRKGDPMLDENGNPIIDELSGVVRYLSITMLEYEYTLDTTIDYSDYKGNVNKLLRQYIDDDMSELNSNMLDNTTVFFSPTRSNDSVAIDVGQRRYVVDQFITPTVSLYVDENSTIVTDDTTHLRSVVGMVLHKHLDLGIINLNNIKLDIESVFGTSLKGVKISGLDGGRDFELFSIKNNTSRLTIKKKIVYDDELNVNVEYDINILIHKI